MNVAIVTNLRAPYRTLQINEFSKIDNVTITTYYTDNQKENRKWNVSDAKGFNEIDLEGFNLLNKYGYINKGLVNIVKENDLILLCGYEKPTYILLSIICRLFKKPYILIFDGISTNRLTEKENPIKKFIKNIVISHTDYIMGNGTISKRYFNEVFNYPMERIYNQYLTVDSNKINELYKNKEKYRKEYREKLNINESDRVLIYSGRLIDIKNVDSVVKAISKMKKEDIVFLITGGGKLEGDINSLSDKLGVRTIITGFISEQEELFKYYFAGDALILPSVYEPWGLVVHEAMFAGLPVIVSKNCGCSLDLLDNNMNGYLIDPYNLDDICEKIKKVLYINDIEKMSLKSRSIIKDWTFIKSKEVLLKIICLLK